MTAFVAGGMSGDAICFYFSKFFATISYSILVAKLVRCSLVLGGVSSGAGIV